MKGGIIIKVLIVIGSVATLFFVIPKFAEAHQSGCHRWHSCPSDTGSYTCGDLGYTSQCGYFSYSTPYSTPYITPYLTPYSTPYQTPITVKSFSVYKKVGYDKVVLQDSSSDYLISFGIGCSSYDFYEGQILYINTYFSPGIFNDIYTSLYESSKKCSIRDSTTLNLKRFYVDNVIDSKDNIIITSLSTSTQYLVEYGIGCLSMWRYENKSIDIDVGGSFLDGIGDRIYLFDSDDDCSVWDADTITGSPSYIPVSPTPILPPPIITPIPSPSPTPVPVLPPPPPPGLQPLLTFSADKTTVNKGEPVTLSWTNLNGTALDSNFGAIGMSGSKVVQPDKTTTYTVTITDGDSGKFDTKDLRIEVKNPQVKGKTKITPKKVPAKKVPAKSKKR